jgi:hypothetical protein
MFTMTNISSLPFTRPLGSFHFSSLFFLFFFNDILLTDTDPPPSPCRIQNLLIFFLSHPYLLLGLQTLVFLILALLIIKLVKAIINTVLQLVGCLIWLVCYGMLLAGIIGFAGLVLRDKFDMDMNIGESVRVWEDGWHMVMKDNEI